MDLTVGIGLTGGCAFDIPDLVPCLLVVNNEEHEAVVANYLLSQILKRMGTPGHRWHQEVLTEQLETPNLFNDPQGDGDDEVLSSDEGGSDKE